MKTKIWLQANPNIDILYVSPEKSVDAIFSFVTLCLFVLHFFAIFNISRRVCALIVLFQIISILKSGCAYKVSGPPQPIYPWALSIQK
jgi:hypothetical protein